MAEPRVRFRQIDGSGYPAWKEVILGDIAKRITRKNSQNETDRPLTIASIEGLVDQRTYFGKAVASKDMSGYFLLKKGEYAYNKSYSVGYDYGSIKRLDKYDMGALSTLYICFALNEGENSDFYDCYFNGLSWYNQMSEICAEGARNHGLLNVSVNEFFKIKLMIPSSLEEQQKIADFFGSVDDVISSCEAEIENLEMQKKSAMQQIFSQAVRFKKQDGSEFSDWVLRPLNYYLSENKERNKNRQYTKEDVMSVSKDFGVINQIAYLRKSLAGEDLSNYHCVYKGNVVYTKSPLGKQPYGIIKASKVDGIVSTLYAVYYCNKLALPEFIDLYFSRDAELNNYLKPLVNIGAKHDMKVNNDVAISGMVTFPTDIEEQRLIVDLFADFDDAIAAAKRELELWKDLKKGLLQQMFV